MHLYSFKCCQNVIFFLCNGKYIYYQNMVSQGITMKPHDIKQVPHKFVFFIGGSKYKLHDSHQ